MGTKENFNQAMHEVFSFHKNSKETGEAVNTSNLAENLNEEPSSPQPNDPVDFKTVYDQEMQQKIETAHITKDTKITGSITSKSNLEISGVVYGDIESQNSVKISGKIEGNVSGKNIEINHAVIKGDIHASENMIVINQSNILGNIFSTELEFNSKINGNINVKKDIIIQKDSIVIGDISAASIHVESGAVLKSMMNIVGDKDDENLV